MNWARLVELQKKSLSQKGLQSSPECLQKKLDVDSKLQLKHKSNNNTLFSL